MKLTKHSLLAASTMLIGGLLGASALVAAAGTWNPPTSDAPNGNALAPINVGVLNGTTIQEKFDSLLVDGGLGVVGTLIAPKLRVSTSTANPTIQAGDVLTAADAFGNVKWADAGGSAGVTSGGDAANGYWYRVGPLLIQGGIAFPGTQTWKTVTYPMPYSAVASVQVTPLDSNGPSQVHPEQQVMAQDITTTSFKYRTVNNDGATWLAVGTALDVVPLSANGVSCTISTTTNSTKYTFTGSISGSSPSTDLYYYQSKTDATLNNRPVTVPGMYSQSSSASTYATQGGQYLKITSPYSSQITVPCTL